MMARLLFREDVDAAPCGGGLAMRRDGEDGRRLHARCHHGDPFRWSVGEAGALRLRCDTCGRLVAAFAAPTPQVAPSVVTRVHYHDGLLTLWYQRGDTELFEMLRVRSKNEAH